MQPVVDCMTFFRNHQETIEKVKSARDYFVKPIERTSLFLNILMLVLSLIFMISGVSFVNENLWTDSQHYLDKIKR